MIGVHNLKVLAVLLLLPAAAYSNVFLQQAPGTDGLAFSGAGIDGFGRNVSGAGDLNGDGVDDFVIRGSQNGPGEVWVVFGNRAWAQPVIAVDQLAGSDVLRLTEPFGSFGTAIAPVGDVNGDGIEDLFLGAPGSGSGTAYLVHGSRSLPATLAVDQMSSTEGAVFGLPGVVANRQIAWAVAGGGDFNGDGHQDLLIGGPNIGSDVYLLPGREGGFSGFIALNSLAAVGGATIDDDSDCSGFGFQVAFGNFNGDGFDDAAIARTPFGDCIQQPTAAFVIFGREAIPAGMNALAEVAAGRGMQIRTDSGLDQGCAGACQIRSLTVANYNNDGFDDLVLGIPNYRPAGVTWVVNGSDTLAGASITEEDLDGSNGVRLVAAQDDAEGDHVNGMGFGGAVVSLDFNGDQTDDLAIAAECYSASQFQGLGCDGLGYVVNELGMNPGILTLDVAAFNTESGGFRMASEASGSQLGAALANAGDINGDGFDDLIFGNRAPSPFSTDVFVIFGRAFNGVFHSGFE